MNERILEIARESGLLVHNPAGVPTKLEKFAELIVRECMAQCTKVEEDDELSGVSDGALLCREEIKEHFGVEE